MATLGCPRCDTQLNKQADGKFACAACGIDFPNITTATGVIPMLWPEPGAALLDWRNRYNAALADIEQRVADTAAADPAAGDAAKARISHLHKAWQRHLEELSDVLAPLQVGEAIAKETHLALRTTLPSHHGVLSYAQNIHRDWCWGDTENKQVAEHLMTALKSTDTPTNMLVLGAGAGRLAYDLHAALDLQESWGLDSNPLLCLIGQEMAGGHQIQFTEFPLAPISALDSAVTRTLSSPAKLSGLNFVCADALRPPFLAGQFDLVVTPWLLDVIDAPLDTLIRTIKRLLRPGGIWLNHGSVAFSGAHAANCLSREELADISTAMGFTLQHQSDLQIPYLQSPASRQRREEITYTQVALRDLSIAAEPAPRHQHLPEWIVSGRTPVPLSGAFQSQIHTTRIHAFIMSLIDGKRSLRDMAKTLEEQRLMPASQAQQALRQFLTTMYEEAARLEGQAAKKDTN